MIAPSLYARLLGSSFEGLSPILKNIHDSRTSKRFVGRCDVRGGSGWAARAIAWIGRLPVAKEDVPLEIAIDANGRGERWTRSFGAHQMQSRLSDRNRRLEERLGPLVLTFELAAEHERIVWSLQAARLAFVPLPVAWLLTCAATEAIDNGRYGFDVSAHVRGVGLIVHYKGWLVDKARLTGS